MKRVSKLDKYILGFYVSVYKTRRLRMQVLKNISRLKEKLRDFRSLDSVQFMLLFQIPQRQILHDQLRPRTLYKLLKADNVFL
jgi:hypothetical protein